MTDRQKYYEPTIQQRNDCDKQHIELTYIIHFYFDQRSPETLFQLLEGYEKYSSNILDRVQFVIVDDCSKLEVNPPESKLNIIWLKITDNIMWNQGGARNLGVVYAKSDKILISDLDIEFPEQTLRRMIEMRNPGKRFYKIPRRERTSSRIYSGHPNVFFMSRARFMRLYGYDEEFSGGYGAEDYRFVKYQKYHGSWQRSFPKKYFCYIRREIDRKKAYHSLLRDFERNTPIDQRKRNELLTWGAEAGHSRIFLNFNWKKIKETSRPVPEKRKNRHWKHLWWFRTLIGSW